MNEVVSTDRLADALWGESPPRAAANVIQGHVSDLRKVLGRETIATRPGGYAIVVDPDRVESQPLLVAPGSDGLLAAADDAGLVVVGLSDRWRQDGLGPVRLALAERARPPVLLVRRGLRPGGLPPSASRTRFTWSLRPV
jgi:hypothetical protein